MSSTRIRKDLRELEGHDGVSQILQSIVLSPHPRLQPLSAFLDEEKPSRPDPKEVGSPPVTSEAPRRSSLARWSRSRPPASQTQPPAMAPDTQQNMLRVTVAVLMPLRRDQTHTPTEQYHLPVYELGLTDLSWDGRPDIAPPPDASTDAPRSDPPA